MFGLDLSPNHSGASSIPPPSCPSLLTLLPFQDVWSCYILIKRLIEFLATKMPLYKSYCMFVCDQVESLPFPRFLKVTKGHPMFYSRPLRLPHTFSSKSLHAAWKSCKYRVSQKNVPMFQTAITPSKLALGIKVGWVLKSSANPLADGNWNFLLLTFGGWKNGV